MRSGGGQEAAHRRGEGSNHDLALQQNCFFFYIFLLNFLILNDLGVRGAIASMRVLLVCPSDFAMHWMLDQKI